MVTYAHNNEQTMGLGFARESERKFGKYAAILPIQRDRFCGGLGGAVFRYGV